MGSLATLSVENTNSQKFDISQLVKSFVDVIARKVNCNWNLLYVLSHITLFYVKGYSVNFYICICL